MTITLSRVPSPYRQVVPRILKVKAAGFRYINDERFLAESLALEMEHQRQLEAQLRAAGAVDGMEVARAFLMQGRPKPLIDPMEGPGAAVIAAHQQQQQLFGYVPIEPPEDPPPRLRQPGAGGDDGFGGWEGRGASPPQRKQVSFSPPRGSSRGGGFGEGGLRNR